MEEEYDIPNELIHHIQSLLPPKDAARTSVLSKSWLHAWSTINVLRFAKCVPRLTEQEQIDYTNCINRTLLRYRTQSMSINCFHLHLDIQNFSLSYPVENWFQELAAFTNPTLKELCLTTCGYEFFSTVRVFSWLTLPDEIFSYENLNILSIRANKMGNICWVRVNTNPVFHCLFLRVLELYDVFISEEVLHNLFSSCSLLEKINIYFHSSVCLKMVKVKNLRCLRELKLNTENNQVLELEMYDLPRLQLLSYLYVPTRYTIRMDTLGSVTELVLLCVNVDDAFCNMIKSKFPFLETLTLEIEDCMLETIDITCVSLKRMTVSMSLDEELTVQVYASKLLYFCYDGSKMPTLLFPSSTPARIQLILRFLKNDPVDMSFFLKVREALDISSNVDIEAVDYFVPLDIKLGDLRRMVPFPARNVQQLSFGKQFRKKRWKQSHSRLLEFLFSICYPHYVKAYYTTSDSKKYFYKQMAGMMEKKTCNLKDIETKNPHDGKWESLPYFWRRYHFLFELPLRSFNDEDYNSEEFKLSWLS